VFRIATPSPDRSASAHAPEAAPPAIVIGLDCITGLQTARALHRHDVRVSGVAHDPDHFALRTRCVERVVCTERDDAALLGGLAGLATPARPVLIPATDRAVDVVARHAAALSSSFRIADPEGTSVARALDKAPFALHVEAHGIPAPRTRRVETLEDLRRAAGALSPPYVLKPDRKDDRWMAWTGVKVLLAEDATALERTWERARAGSDRFVVQEWIDGGDSQMYSYYAFVAENGRTLAECVGHKIRQWPRRTGSGTLSEIREDPEVVEVGRDLLAGLAHRGFATVNMKRAETTGRLYVIEANLGRPGMGMFVAEASGLEMTWLAYRSMAGLPLPAPSGVRFPDARWISLKRDLASAFTAWREGDLGPRAYLRSIRGVRRFAVLDLSDPAPFVADVLRLPGQLGRGRPRRSVE